jgi:AcrR family transcriptional regulator
MTAPASPRITARREATRDAILAAAWDLAREVGLTGFTLRELAARVGLTAPSLYEYFAGKDAIYDAMFARGSQAFLTAVRASRPAEGTHARTALRDAVHTFLDFATEDPVRFQLLFQHAIAGWEPSAAAYDPAVEAYELTRAYLAEFGLRDQRSLDLWTAMVSGLAHQQVANDPGGTRWHDLVDEVVELFLHHLATAAGGGREAPPSTPSRDD